MIIVCKQWLNTVFCRFNSDARTASMQRKNITFNGFKNRTFLAIVLTLIASVVMIPGMATYLPLHKNDAIGLPTLFFPFIWTALFIYSYMARSITKVWLVMSALILIHIACIYFALSGNTP
ncbi:hypothetical protein [Paraglaciecola sp.]|uniref:hypothetical protein n=1 Tax=Paraglaciecola sp. TaxID=1920173 RepID=UPI003264CD9E